MDIELKIKSWNDVSIDKYYEILDIFKDDSKAEFDKYMSLLALLCDVDEDVVYSLDIFKAQAMFNAISWINDFSFLKKKGGMGAIKSVVIDGKKYNVCVDLQKFTVSQYIDFQTFWHKKDLEKYYGNILAIFLLPEGCKYGEGYDVAELATTIRQKVSIVTANQVCFFFLNSLAISIKGIQIYLDWMKRKMKNKENRKQMETVSKNLQMIQKYIFLG